MKGEFLILLLGIIGAILVAINQQTKFDECVNGNGHCIISAPCKFDSVHPDLCCYCSAPLGEDNKENV